MPQTARLLAHNISRPARIALAVGYYAYCVYGKTKRTDKETEPLMPVVATATPMA